MLSIFSSSVDPPEATTQVCVSCSHWIQFCLELFQGKSWEEEQRESNRFEVGQIVKCHVGCCEYLLSFHQERRDAHYGSGKGSCECSFTCTSRRAQSELLHASSSCCVCVRLFLGRIWELERSRGDWDGTRQPPLDKEEVFRCLALTCSGPTSGARIAERVLVLTGEHGSLDLRINGAKMPGSLTATCIGTSTTDADMQRRSQRQDATWIHQARDLDGWRLTMIQDWISKCRRHKKCNRTSAERFRPSRLIFVGNGINIKNDFPRLVSRQGRPEDSAVYATLSHCWGGKVFSTLTKQNLEAFHSKIPVEGLTKTFADAIYFCRKLGIKWLWIDSLCIIQDDDADWSMESSCMHDIYRFSFLNLAASGSLNGLGGLFRPSRHHAFLPVEITVRLTSGEVVSLGDNPQISGELNKENSAVLWRRAWVAQERFFSRRQVIFGTNQIFWVCRSRQDLECCRRVASLPKENILWYDIHKKRLSEGVNPLKNDGYLEGMRRLFAAFSSHKELDRCWYALCSKYSTTDVTFAKDRVIALSGMAKEFQKMYASRNVRTAYAAGLWLHDMVTGLLWRFRAFEPPRRPPHTLTPSWSWIGLGIASGVDFCAIEAGYEPLVDLTEVRVTPLNPIIPHGPCSGSVFLRGWLIANGSHPEAGRSMGSPNLQFQCVCKSESGGFGMHGKIRAIRPREDGRRASFEAKLYLDHPLDGPLDGPQQELQLEERLSKSYLLPLVRVATEASIFTTSRKPAYEGLIVEEVRERKDERAVVRRLGLWMGAGSSYSKESLRLASELPRLLGKESMRKVELT